MMMLAIILFLVASVASKFLSVGLFSNVMGSGMQASVFSAVSLVTASEFSLMIAKKVGNLVGFDIITLMTVSLFLSAVVSAVMMKNIPSLARDIDINVPFSTKSRMKSVSAYINIVTKEFEPKGAFYGLFVGCMRRIIICVALLAASNGLITLLSGHIGELSYAPVPAFGDITIGVALHVLVSALLIFKIVDEAHQVVDGFLGTFYRVDRRNFEMDQRIVYGGIGAMMLVLLSALLPFVFSAMSGAVMGLVQLGAVLLSIILIVEIISTAHRMVEGGIGRKISYARKRQKSLLLDMVGLQRI
jgi:hypothetical protein